MQEYCILQVLKKGEGEYVVVKRPIKPQPGYKYIPCSYCYGFFHKKTLTKHARKCYFNESHQNNSAVASGLVLLGPSSIPADDAWLHTLLNGMKETHANTGTHHIQMSKYAHVEVC